MANIKELKKRIKSTKQTLKITKAMKLVSAAKLAKAQDAVLGARPYAQELEKTIKIIGPLAESYHHQYLEEQESKKELLLVISSDKGLCGGYNSQLVKKIKLELLQKKEEGIELEIRTVGKKAKELLKSFSVLGKDYLFEKAPKQEDIRQVAQELSSLFCEGSYGKILVAYNQFQSVLQFNSTIKQVLPLSMPSEGKEELREKFPFDFKYDAPPQEILDELIPESYVATLFTALLDAQASEHGSRMAAMDSASKNCNEVIRKLTLKMNKLRQAAITTELIEVISGAEALNS